MAYCCSEWGRFFPRRSPSGVYAPADRIPEERYHRRSRRRPSRLGGTGRKNSRVGGRRSPHAYRRVLPVYLVLRYLRRWNLAGQLSVDDRRRFEYPVAGTSSRTSSPISSSRPQFTVPSSRSSVAGSRLLGGIPVRSSRRGDPLPTVPGTATDDIETRPKRPATPRPREPATLTSPRVAAVRSLPR